MGAFSITSPSKYKANTAKTQTVTNAALPIDPPVLGDAVKVPENILIIASSVNTEPVMVGFDSSVLSTGPGIELPAGANVNLPTKRPQDVYVISASGGQTIQIVYSQGVE